MEGKIVIGEFVDKDMTEYGASLRDIAREQGGEVDG
jgi:hypothetical protein